MLCKDRVNRKELMDAPGTSTEELRRGLRDLVMANRLFGGYSSIIPHLRKIFDSGRNQIRVLDVGCGAADVSKLLIDEARRRGAVVELIGLDLNPRLLAFTREWRKDYPEMQFVLGDARNLPFADASFDLVFSSTLVHHLDPPDVIRMISEARRVASEMVVISDLIRSSAAYVGIWLFGHLFFSRVSRIDGAISVCRSYLPQDLYEFGVKAGLHSCRVYKHLISRMALVCSVREK